MSVFLYFRKWGRNLYIVWSSGSNWDGKIPDSTHSNGWFCQCKYRFNAADWIFIFHIIAVTLKSIISDNFGQYQQQFKTLKWFTFNLLLNQGEIWNFSKVFKINNILLFLDVWFLGALAAFCLGTNNSLLVAFVIMGGGIYNHSECLLNRSYQPLHIAELCTFIRDLCLNWLKEAF